MQVVFHIGAHATGQDRLIRTLLKNRDLLAAEGVWVPGPGRYRRTIVEATGTASQYDVKLDGHAIQCRITTEDPTNNFIPDYGRITAYRGATGIDLERDPSILTGARAAPEAVDVLLETILDSDDAGRVILSGENFICTPATVLEYGQLYPRAGKSAWLRNAFPDAEVEFAFTLRNLATFLPALDEETGGTLAPCPDPLALRWSDVIEVIGDANPGAPILVWRAEDAAILLPEIVREIADLSGTAPLTGCNDLTRQALNEAGQHELDRLLADAPPESEVARRYLIADLLAEYGADAGPDPWPEGMAEALTEAYEADLDRIRRLPGVTLLEP